MRILSNILKALSLASIASLSFVSIASAQSSDAIGLRVTPPIYQFTIKPGDVQPSIVVITNVGSKQETFYPQVRDFTALNETGAPNYLNVGADSGTYSLTKWISFSNQPISLKPNESQALNFNITVPANAEPGGHYGGLLFSTKAPEVSGTGVAVNSIVAAPILVRVAGTAKEALSVKEFSTDKSSYNTANVNFNLRLENTGNVHLQPKGVIVIKNAFGGQIASIDINQNGGNVLPGSIRKFTFTWKDPGFKIGLYTATATVNYGNPNQTISSQTSFWILPLGTILVLLILVVLLITALYFAIKRYNAWIVYKATQNKS